MKKIKAICFNYFNYCKYPAGINSIKDFIRYVNEHYNTFIELELFSSKDCIAPFFIEENETEIQYWNPALIRMINETEISVLTKDEYDEKLKKAIAKKCVNCVHYIDDGGEDLDSHREKLSLLGECDGFEKKTDLLFD